MKITGLFALVLTTCTHLASFGNPLGQMGLIPLQVIQPSLNGSGVFVAQPEFGTDDSWQVNPAIVGQAESKFRWISNDGIATSFPNGLGAESEHANSVGLNFFGNPNGMSPGVTQIDNYEVNHFVGSIIYAATPPAIPAKIVNQSFIFTTQDSVAEQRFDNYAANFNVLFASGIGNGTPENDIEVMPPGTAYNGIGVGAFGGQSSVGPTIDGRCKPDIVAPASATSYSTPYVSGAAALLVQAGREGIGGANTNAATDIRTLKALLLNGAVKPTGWTNHPSHPLDMRYGSGVLNVLNSFKQLASGQQSFVEATSHPSSGAHPPGNSPNNLSPIGWDFSAITNQPSNQARVHHYYFVVPTNDSPKKFTATLTWNRAADSSSINNLDLFLYNTLSGSVVAVSTSTVDNVEHIFIPQLTPGRYDLQVLKRATTNPLSVDTYAIAYESVSTALEIDRAGGNILLNWPVYPHGFTLESTDSLTPPISWSTVAGAPSIVSEQYQLLLPASAPQQYYRLRQP